VRGMHLLLLQALGKQLPNAPRCPERLPVQFVRAAANVEVPS
jgi:hypothetical protein